jgi:hypothetical protein
MPMLELKLADGGELDIPSEAIIMFEGMVKGDNPNFPEAVSFVRYVIGQDLKTALLLNSYRELVLMIRMQVKATQRWLFLTLENGEGLAVGADHIVSRMTIKDEKKPDVNCEIIVNIGAQAPSFFVRETRAEIKDLSERPAGLIELPISGQESEHVQ